MRRAVVADPEHASRGSVRLGGHHLRDESIDGRNGRRRFAAAKQFRALDIPGGEVGQRARSEVLVFDAHWTSRTWRESWMFAPPGLETRFLVGRNDQFVRPERDSLPGFGIEIQDQARSLGELRVTRKDPAAMAPGLQRIRTQPAPERNTADSGDEAAREHLRMEFRNGESRQRHTQPTGQFAREPLNVDDDAGGKSGLDARLAVLPPGPSGGHRKTVSATC